MRWFLTDNHPLAEALTLAGQEVVSRPEDWTPGYLQGAITSSSYPLSGLALARGAEVVVLVNPIREFQAGEGRVEFGFGRGYAKSLRTRKVALGMIADDNPETINRFLSKAHKTCTCNLQDATFWVVPNSEVGNLVRSGRRTVVWNPGQGAGGLVEAVGELLARKVYRAKDDGHRWG